MEQKRLPWYFLALLILAGESVFVIPFVLSRVFRPTVLEVFQLTNFELGKCFSVYGIVALISYLIGGPLADKYPPRKLMAFGLWLTGAGGFIYASNPNLITLQILYGFWGFTTIFLFWAPMIKATRLWGGQHSQGKAFGILDGGRGLVGALFGLVGVLIFSFLIPESSSEIGRDISTKAFQQLIYIVIGATAVIGLLVFNFLKLNKETEREISLEKIRISQIIEVLKIPSVSLLMIIILCAYVGYKITDDFSLYAQDILNYNQVNAAKIGTFLLFLRPIIGVTIGVIADKTAITKWLLISFIIAFLGALLFAFGFTESGSLFFFLTSIFIIAAGVYACRSLYFAVMKKGKIPIIYTGTAVGLISIIGYTPDIFVGLVMGHLLDSSPGAVGHQHVFWMLAVFSLIGAITSFIYHRLYGK